MPSDNANFSRLSVIYAVERKRFYLVTVLLEPLYGFRKSISQVFLSLKRIVEYYNRAVAGIFLHVVEHLFAAQFFAVIAGDHVPHDDFVFLPQFVSLAETHVPVWRAEQRTLNQFVGGIDIAHIILDGVFHALNVIHRVIARVVSAFENLGISNL